MKPQKIAFFTPSLNIGGVERVFMTYANSLTTYYLVDYVVCHTEGDIKHYLNQDVNCIILHKRLPYTLFKLAKYIRKYKPDYLISGGDIPNAITIIANIIAGNKTKVIISQHNYLNSEQKIYLSRFIYRFIYNYAHKIIAVSPSIASFLNEFNIKETQIITITNPINVHSIQDLSISTESLKKQDYSKYILYVGRLSPVKNLEFLIKSFARLKSKKHDLNLVIAGTGPMLDTLKHLVEKFNIQNSVFFLGVVSNPYPLISNSLFTVLPSFSEALPTIILECFALGKTIVGTPTKGALELSNNGKYCHISKRFDNEEEFSELMNKALSFSVNIEELREYAYTFDISYKIKEIQNILV